MTAFCFLVHTEKRGQNVVPPRARKNWRHAGQPASNMKTNEILAGNLFINFDSDTILYTTITTCHYYYYTITTTVI